MASNETGSSTNDRSHADKAATKQTEADNGVGNACGTDEFGLPIKKIQGLSVEDASSTPKTQAQADAESTTCVSKTPPNELGSHTDTQSAKHASDAEVGKGLAQSNGNGTISNQDAPSHPPKTEPDEPTDPSQAAKASAKTHEYKTSASSNFFSENPPDNTVVSEWSHQQLAPKVTKEDATKKEEDEWQDMPAYAPYDIYNDDGKLVAREEKEVDEATAYYNNLGGAGKGYTRVQVDDDAESATSMDENTAYLFKESGTNVIDEDDEARNPLDQMQATKDLLTEGQRIAYVGITRLAMMQMIKDLDVLERTKGTKKDVDTALEAMKMWSQKIMVRLYSHMEIDAAEQVMIEQLAEHGVMPSDLTPTLMQNARVKNPLATDGATNGSSESLPKSNSATEKLSPSLGSDNGRESKDYLTTPSSKEHEGGDDPDVQTPAQLPNTQNIDIDIRWTVLCDLFLVLIADSIYDARSRQLLERVGSYLDVPWLDICRFEKRVTDALEMQEAANKENWNEQEHMQNREKLARNRRLMMMGLATVGGSLVIGLSAGLLAPVIGAGLAAGFTTIGVAGTSGFLAGAGGAAIITSAAVVSGGTIAVRASGRRLGAVKTFEYRPLHNNKRVNLIVTVAGWMVGKIDDVRLPYSTVDPVMGDIYSVFWEPEMLQSMGNTINILATEALTQGLQQILGSTVLVMLMASLQLPIVLTKLSYLIDNPWTSSLARADLAGLILADSLIDRNLGVRPVTLVGFSLGSRVIFACLKELAKKGAYGLVQNVYLFGSPMVVRKDDYIKAKAVVSGRFVNGYATNDWILGYLFRATSAAVTRVAGLAPVEIPGIENINVTDLVPGHMAYRAMMPRLLREVGWMVESDEFSEIEDPDPENHEARQRELINEIEEARKQLEKKPEKRRFGIFKAKKYAEKKEWETYDERSKGKPEETSDVDGTKVKDAGVLFDIDAIRAEAAELAAQGFQIKQLDSTLPPMVLSPTKPEPPPTLRETKSFDDSIAATRLASPSSSSLPVTEHTPRRGSAYEYGEREHFTTNGAADGDISLTFDTAYEPSSVPATQIPHITTSEPALQEPPHRPPLTTSVTMPVGNLSLEHNAWAEDDDDFGQEKEMKMTFE